MKQTQELLQKFTKPSDILRQAHLEGICKIENTAADSHGGYCALGVIGIKFKQDINKIFAETRFGKPDNQLSNDQFYDISNIITSLIRLNDSSSNVTFLDCAEFLEKQGL